MSEEKSLAEILLEYALSEGASKIHELRGLWESTIDDHWTIKCNGHKETMEGVQPFCWYIEYNGWPAGIIKLRGEGMIAAGEGANEQTLIAAIEAKMKVKS